MTDSESVLKSLDRRLREILDVELALGNEVVECWDNWGIGVLLKYSFRHDHAQELGVRYRELDGPHYWRNEYSLEEKKQIIGSQGERK